MSKVLAATCDKCHHNSDGSNASHPYPPPPLPVHLQYQQLKTPHLRSRHTGGSRISLRFETKSEY